MARLPSYDGVRLAIDCPDRYRGVVRAASGALVAAGGVASTLPEIDHVLTHAWARNIGHSAPSRGGGVARLTGRVDGALRIANHLRVRLA